MIVIHYKNIIHNTLEYSKVLDISIRITHKTKNTRTIILCHNNAIEKQCFVVREKLSISIGKYIII